MDEFTRHERGLLDAFQQEDSPSAQDAARVKERVLMAAGVLTAASAATTTVAKAAASGTSAASTVAAASATAGTVGGVGAWKAVLAVGIAVGLGGGAYAASTQGGFSLSPRPLPARVEGSGSNVEPGSSAGAEGAATTQHAAAAWEKKAVAHKEEPAALKTEPALSTMEAPPALREERVLDRAAAPGDRNAARAQPLPTKRRAVTPAPVGDPSTLKEEALLLSSAHAALQRGAPKRAIAVLSEHRAQYPKGVLSGEREAALSVAYCQSGALAQGQRRARDFIRRSPQSPMVQRLQAACKLPSE